MKRLILSGLALILAVILFLPPAFAHSGRTDSSGGHKDNQNASGLGSYHYHHGYGPHLHPGGVCPYEAKPTAPKTPTPTPPKTTTPAPKEPTITAMHISSTVYVNGVTKPFDAYNIDGNNYFKLRDLAYVLSGTEKQFDVLWDNNNQAISLVKDQAYTKVGGEMSIKGSGSASATPTKAKVFLGSTEVSFTAYSIGNNNYFKLRDIGRAFDFGVAWDEATGEIAINTSMAYQE